MSVQFITFQCINLITVKSVTFQIHRAPLPSWQNVWRLIVLGSSRFPQNRDIKSPEVIRSTLVSRASRINFYCLLRQLSMKQKFSFFTKIYLFISKFIPSSAKLYRKYTGFVFTIYISLLISRTYQNLIYYDMEMEFQLSQVNLM
jgi:hypothetical protein